MPAHEPPNEGSTAGGDDELAEMSYVPDRDLEALERGVPLADFECRHGRLLGDAELACGCWS